MSWRKPLRWLRDRVRRFGRSQGSDSSEDTVPLIGDNDDRERPAGVEQDAPGRWRQYPEDLNPFSWPDTAGAEAAASTPASDSRESEAAESPQGAVRFTGRSQFYICRDPNSDLPPLPVGSPPFLLRTPPPPYDGRRRSRPSVETPGQLLGVPLDLHRGRRDLSRSGIEAEESASQEEGREGEQDLLLHHSVAPADPEARHRRETARLERLAAGTQLLDQTYTIETSSEDELFTTAQEEFGSSSDDSGRRAEAQGMQSALARPSDR